MKLLRIGEVGSERPAVLTGDDTYVDVSAVTEDFDAAFFEVDALGAVRQFVSEQVHAGSVGRLGNQRIGAPIARPHQILCIGLNYLDHAAETGQSVPDEPIVFNKAPNTLIGPNDEVRIPRGSTKTDWEVELGLVVGPRASYLDNAEEGARHIAGYVLVNDVSERAFQLERGGQWVKGKSSSTFNPAGPFLVTADEIEDPLKLRLWLDVDGQRRQTGSTASMIFSPGYIVWYLSQFMTLEPGDLVNTGTPPGVGMALDPPTFLTGGELVELGIEHLGSQHQRVVAWPGAHS